jgi:hypothetical protein
VAVPRQKFVAIRELIGRLRLPVPRGEARRS